MSKFFRALEQAERERALREQARRQDRSQSEVASPVPESPVECREAVASEQLVQESSTPRLVHRQPELESVSKLSKESRERVEEHLVSLLTPASFAAEQYRALRHMVEQMHKSTGLSIVAVTSSAVGEGKTTTAINLAGALAQARDARVLLVDADLRRSSVTQQLGFDDGDGYGLVDAILKPDLSLEQTAKPRPPFNLSVLPAGRLPVVSYEVLKSPRLGELLEQARHQYDYVVLDTPPLVPLPDCRVIGKWVDGFLVVVAAHKTPTKLVEEALHVMDPAKIVGLIFNGDERPLSGYYSAYYGPYAGSNGTEWWGWAAQKVGGALHHLWVHRLVMPRGNGRGR